MTFPPKSLAGRLALAITIGVFAVTLSVVIPAILRGNTIVLAGNWGILGVNAMIAAAPFIGLAIGNIRQPRAWTIALVLTVLLWGYYIADPFLRGAGDANIGLGILMLISPVPIAIVSLVFRGRS